MVAMWPIGIPIVGWLFIPITILIVILAYPFYMLSASLGMREFARSAATAEVNDDGVFIEEPNGRQFMVEWSDVRRVQRTFDPPFLFWSLVLNSGQSVALHHCESEQLLQRAKENGITISKKWG